MFNKICVYCGSSYGRRPEYTTGAKELAKLLADYDIDLVYGGAQVGIMGVIADTVLQYGGNVIGVIPEALVDKEIAHTGLTELHVVSSMHERKALMAELADGFVALPGGLGTAEELFEMLTWSQLGLHRKPVGLLNLCGYYDHLASFLDHAVSEQFVRDSHRSMIMMEEDPRQLLGQFNGFKAPDTKKWIHRDQT